MGSKTLVVLRKMLQHTEAIMTYCRDCTDLKSFEDNPMRVEATIFNLMQLGELAKQSLDEETKAQIPSIPWPQIYGLRNRIVHGYSGVSMRIVWETVSEDIPILRRELEEVIRSFQAD